MKYIPAVKKLYKRFLPRWTAKKGEQREQNAERHGLLVELLVGAGVISVSLVKTEKSFNQSTS